MLTLAALAAMLPAMAAAQEVTQGSYSAVQETFQGTIAGGHSAAKLLDHDIVSPDGKPIGRINDLLIAPDGTVAQVLVDVGSFLGIGYRTVAVDLALLQPDKDDADAFVVPMDSAELQTLPAYKRYENGWRLAID